MSIHTSIQHGFTVLSSPVTHWPEIRSAPWQITVLMIVQYFIWTS